MWTSEVPQNCAMMGVQATCGKRKLEVGGGGVCKAARWEAGEDCLARLRAVSASVPDCGPCFPTAHRVSVTSHHHHSGAHHHASTHQAPDSDSDEGWEDDDDYEQPPPPPAPRPVLHPPPPHYYWQHPQQHQIRSENGKSYLELGPAPPSPCYRQRRLAVLNLSMCKLARYRQCSDPSLRRSVLICNTLRHIEREMEREGGSPAGGWYPAAPPPAPPSPAPPPPAPEPPATPDSAFSDHINWGSVLTLATDSNSWSLQPPEPPSPPPPSPHHDTWDSFVHVLVSGT